MMIRQRTLWGAIGWAATIFCVVNAEDNAQKPTDKEEKKPLPLFTGGPTNLVPNNGFEISDDSVKPKLWEPVFKTHPAFPDAVRKDLKVSLDGEVRHSGQRSLCLSGSSQSMAGVESIVYSIIDYSRTFTLSGYIKCENATGATFLEIDWFRMWMPMGYGWASERRNYGAHWNLVEPVGVERTAVTSGTHDWKKFSVTAKPPAGANHVRFSVWSMDNAGKAWVDDLEFDGFGENPAEIMISQIGFPRKGLKKAVVRAKEKTDGGSFTLLDATSGKELFRGTLAYAGECQWKKHNWTADFSVFEQNAAARLAVDIAGTREVSPPFEVSDAFFQKQAERVRSFMFKQRCGCDVPGFHKACHLDDGQLRSKPDLTKGGEIIGHWDASGGWHDAGDYDKYIISASLPIMAMATLSTMSPDGGQLLDEAAWGAEFLIKSTTPDGRIYYRFENQNKYGETKMHYIPPERETDNIIGNADDRYVEGPGFDAISCMALAEFAAAANAVPEHKKLAAAAVKTALSIRGAFLGCEAKMTQRNAALNYFPSLLLTDMALHRLIKDPEYAKTSEKTATSILEALERKDYLNMEKLSAHHLPMGLFWAVEMFALQFPDSPLNDRIKKAMDEMINTELEPFIRQDPYGIVDSRKFYTQPWVPGYNSNSMCGFAAVYAYASILLGKPEYLRRAENLLMYIGGLNPANCCLISGGGWKNFCTFAWSSCIPGYQDGNAVPGSVMKGIILANPEKDGAHVSVANARNGYFFYNVVHPYGYPYAVIASDFPVMGMPGAQEVFEVPSAAYLHALGAVLRARKAVDPAP